MNAQPKTYHVTEYGASGRTREYLAQTPDTAPYVAVRHGVIVGCGPTRAAAAACVVSRCELRPATPEERALLPRLAERRLPADTEAQLLEAIHTDISRVLAAADDDDLLYEYIHEPVLLEYRSIDLQNLSLEAYAALETRREDICADLDELDAMAGQGDLFAAVSA